MSVTRISTRYAKSLIDLSIERGELEVVHNDIEYFIEATKNRDLYLMLKSPIINATKKQQALNAVFGTKMSKTTLAFLDICTRKGREKFLPEIAAAFNDQYNLYNKISTATIITATPLDAAAKEQIKAKLLGSDITMDKVDILTEVDPTIIGGFVIKIGDKLYDASIAHQLEEMKKDLIN